MATPKGDTLNLFYFNILVSDSRPMRRESPCLSYKNAGNMCCCGVPKNVYVGKIAASAC